MHSFKDSLGQEWNLKITIGTMRRIKSELDLDLAAMMQKAEGVDLMTFVDILYVICREQCVDAGISDEQFGERLYGDGLESASDAFMNAYADFCPSHQRKLLQAMMAKIEQGRGEETEKMMEKLESSTFSELFTNMPDMSESNQKVTPSEN